MPPERLEADSPIEAVMGVDHPRQKTLHIAPMLNYSNREFRQLLRILTKKAVLWTEMVVDDTIANAKNLEEHLGYDSAQHPIVCQIGGNDPELCGRAAVVVEKYGYDAIDLNIDCPSDRVSGEREFGAVLLKRVDTALAVVTAMKENSNIPISVKTRVGIDDWDDIEFIAGFIQRMTPVCTRFVIHARKCVLDGLMNARQNRSVPPLNYPRVYELCNLFPDCEFWINGGIHTLQDAKSISFGLSTSHGFDGNELESDGQHSIPCAICNADNGSCTAPPIVAPPDLMGCMLGRAAMDNPCMFFDTDVYFFGEEENPCKTRREVLEQYCAYLERTYPRRCCDSDERTTFDYPAPVVEIERDFCHVCQDIYGEDMDNDVLAEQDISSPQAKAKAESQNEKQLPKAKITPRVIGRCLKPTQGIFAGMPKSRIFRRTCDVLGQDMKVRNCGPGYILRKAMESIPDVILDEEFVKTQD
jgi:tRNA-dihydrouridine synthase A